jgi:hypothetical protein
VAKVIRSAQANAENNFNLVKDDLVIKDIRVEPGPMLKRGQPRAMGRLFSIFKRTSHITAIVEDRPGVVKRRTAALPRAPQPAGRQAPPAAAAAARAAAALEPATTESDERVAPARPKKAKPESKAPASKAPAEGKKTEAKKTDAKKSASPGVERRAQKDDDKKDTKEKKSK